MTDMIPWLGVIVLVLTGWAIVKKYQVNMVLFIGGLLLNVLALFGGLDALMAKGSTGFIGFDLFELLKSISTSQVAGVGFIILISGGFASYMQAIGASDRFVTVCAKPLSFINPDFPLAGLDNNFVRIKELRKPFSLSTFDVENQPIRLFIFIR